MNNEYERDYSNQELPSLPPVPESSGELEPYNAFTDEDSPYFGLSPGWQPTARRPIPTQRCSRIKKDGERCGNRAVRGSGLMVGGQGVGGSSAVCRMHGGQLPNVVKHNEAIVAAARLQITDSAPDAIKTIMELMQSPGTMANVRLAAAKDILDRAGIKNGPDITVEVKDVREKPSDILRKKLESMRDKDADKAEEEDIIDAEPLEDLGEAKAAEESS